MSRALVGRVGLCRALSVGRTRIALHPAPPTNRHQSSDAAGRSQTPWLKKAFWQCRHTWARARINTFRCLVGCSMGDLTTMSYLVTHHPEMDMAAVMGLSSEPLDLPRSLLLIANQVAAGITTSIALETLLLRIGQDRLPLRAALHTACGMSLVSMLAMEMTENCVSLGFSFGEGYSTTTGFWTVTLVSMLAGYIVPLPYNYFRLKHWGKSCH